MITVASFDFPVVGEEGNRIKVKLAVVNESLPDHVTCAHCSTKVVIIKH